MINILKCDKIYQKSRMYHLMNTRTKFYVSLIIIIGDTHFSNCPRCVSYKVKILNHVQYVHLFDIRFISFEGLSILCGQSKSSDQSICENMI